MTAPPDSPAQYIEQYVVGCLPVRPHVTLVYPTGPSVMESLLRFLPSGEDMASLRLLKDEYEELCTAEQFAFMVCFY